MSTLTKQNQTILGKFGLHTLLVGVLFILMGTAGIIVPVVMSLGTVIFSAWLLFLGGVMWGIYTYRYDRKGFINWIKSTLLITVSILMLLYPMPSIEALALLLAIYLLVDAFNSFLLANSIYPAKSWFWMAFNGFTSLLLAILFLFGWPSTSLYLVGLYVGISLFFDGWALFAIGWALRKA
ncbi:HdeD family acid-resistance protein [Brumicola nitratireducens]|uniref:Acid-resistance membrane protein n=1 Tax=Glaciecola nitratireducens (strain JCM 12485 / KCTC 12276 / FR1064) TaxID=1085623 RepID=G4QHH1_GLANF|nr:DUF308 domain-containing protein [Glaciecola nitratireducens]AEP29957.1 hypothetical protein GNIT_1848 [Glaciecola nitratireducens FR1064]